ncbi:hypothetical protein ACN4EE_20290 [Geminocystis sp. CENA526]|uniref:hypothetical protein n=1 Tax=Geminocystis sp. CENA526 TaxID=1355871 RepID=UPI003D6E82F9
MKLLLLDDLVEQGISATEVQQSMTLNCFAKTFRRQSVLPKKFKDKALNLCEEMTQLGQETFIVETNFSYTVWVEEPKIKEQTNKVNSASINNQLNTNNVDQNQNLSASLPVINEEELEVSVSSMEKTEIDSKQTFVPSSYNLFDIASSNSLQKNVRQNRENKPVSAVGEDVKTYRGVVIQDSPKSPSADTSAVKPKGKPITYRGVTYYA